jgi:glucan-binding YG repeat protein
LLATLPANCYASDDKKIYTVSVTVDSNVYAGVVYGEEEINASIIGHSSYSSHRVKSLDKAVKTSEVLSAGEDHSAYGPGQIIENEGEIEAESEGIQTESNDQSAAKPKVWKEKNVPEVNLYFSADEGYVFESVKKLSINISGAELVKASVVDSKTTLKLDVKLPPVSEGTGPVSEVYLTEAGVVHWEKAVGAENYEIWLTRNGQGVTSSYIVASGTQADLKKYISKEGTYQVRVRGINKVNSEKRGSWTDSETIEVTADTLNAIKSGTANDAKPVSGIWVSDENGWRYKKGKTYVKNSWELIKGKWYLFDKKGYMQTGWVKWKNPDTGVEKEYYLNEESGELLTNCTTPDGYILDENGCKKNS